MTDEHAQNRRVALEAASRVQRPREVRLDQYGVAVLSLAEDYLAWLEPPDDTDPEPSPQSVPFVGQPDHMDSLGTARINPATGKHYDCPTCGTDAIEIDTERLLRAHDERRIRDGRALGFVQPDDPERLT